MAALSHNARFRRYLYERRLVNSLALLITLLVGASCGHPYRPVRPSNVPADAVFVLGTKVGWWQQCEPGTSGQPVHCRIWNQGGLVLKDEPFLPYDGGPTPHADELKIVADPLFPGPDRIFLTNDRILLPESRFFELKRFVDWLYDKGGWPID